MTISKMYGTAVKFFYYQLTLCNTPVLLLSDGIFRPARRRVPRLALKGKSRSAIRIPHQNPVRLPDGDCPSQQFGVEFSQRSRIRAIHHNRSRLHSHTRFPFPPIHGIRFFRRGNLLCKHNGFLQNPVAVLPIKFFCGKSSVCIQHNRVHAALSGGLLNPRQKITAHPLPLKRLRNAELIYLIFHAVQPWLSAAQT